MPRKPPMKVEGRPEQAARLRVMGLNYQQIADQVGYASRAAAFNAVKSVMDGAPEVLADRDTLIRMECARLDEIQRAAWSGAMVADPDCARIVLSVMQRRAKMLGLDAPTRTEQKVTTELDAEIEELLRGLGQLQGAVAPPIPTE